MVLSRFLRRAVLFPLSVTAPGLVGCGGQAATDAGGRDAGRDSATDATAPDSSADGSGVDATPAPCTADPNVVSYSYGSCESWTFDFNGTAASCGLGDGGCSLPLSTCEAICPRVDGGEIGVAFCCIEATGTPPSVNQLTCETACVPGRLPRGVASWAPRGSSSPAARFLARMAYFEAASVHAFERLARELAAHEAPERL